MSWHSWVIGWLKGFHCLKVRTLLRFHSDWKFHFVSTTYFFPLIWFGEYPPGSLKRKAQNFQYWKLCAFLLINISLPFNSKFKKTYNWFSPWPKNKTFHFHFHISMDLVTKNLHCIIVWQDSFVMPDKLYLQDYQNLTDKCN